MDKSVKVVFTVVAVGAAAVAAASLLSLKEAKDNLNVLIKDAKLHKIDLTGVEFRANVTLQNPTKNKLTITQPYVKLLQSDTVIASTKVDATTFDLQPLSELPLHTIALKLDWTSILSLITSARITFPTGVNTVFEKIAYCIKNSSKIVESLNLYMEYSTYANGIFYKSKEKIGASSSVNGIADELLINSLGLQSAFQRNIADGKEYEHLFDQKLKHEDKIIIPDGSVFQTVDLMKKVVQKYLGDTKKIAKNLERSNIFETCKAIWNFLYNHIQYKEDQLGLEQIRRPQRSWNDRVTGIDCDCFSVFASSILTNLQIPHKFRITEYDHKGYFQHVYIVVPYQRTHIIIDCVLDKFNTEKKFTNFKDLTMPLNGIDIAVLNAPAISSTDEILGLGASTQDVSKEKALQELYKHLLLTRNEIVKQPDKIKILGLDPYAHVKMIDHALDNWNTPNRDKALRDLELAEIKMNSLNGFDDKEDDLGALFKRNPAKQAAKQQRKEEKQANGKKSNFFHNIAQGVKNIVKNPKEAIKDAAHFIKKTNPVLSVSRNGFLLVLKMNMFRISSKLRWGYATEAQAKKAGLTTEQWQNSIKAVKEVEEMFEKAGGNPDHIKTEVLRGKRALNGLGEAYSIGELGALPAVAAAVAAALPFIAKIKEILKKFKLWKAKDEEFKDGTDENYVEPLDMENLLPNASNNQNADATNYQDSNLPANQKTEDSSNYMSNELPPSTEPNTGFFSKVTQYVKDHPIQSTLIGAASAVLVFLAVKSFGKKEKAPQKYSTSTTLNGAKEIGLREIEIK